MNDKKYRNVKIRWQLFALLFWGSVLLAFPATVCFQIYNKTFSIIPHIIGITLFLLSSFILKVVVETFKKLDKEVLTKHKAV